MTDVRVALTTLGWRVDTSARLRQAVEDFQRGWNLGPALVNDGLPGPATVAALARSLERRAQGLPDFSEHFNAREFACACGGAYGDCRRIWVIRPTVEACEKYRDLVGPFTPSRGCRCTRQNAAVGGAKNSQHLYGAGVDVPVYAITPTQLAKLRFVSGIGRYSWNGRDYVRHFDCRHASAYNTTGSGLSNPAMWSYGAAKSAPLTPRPDLAIDPPTSEEDDDMAMTPTELDAFAAVIARKVWNVPVNRDGGQITALQELADAKTSGITNTTRIAALEAAVGVLANSQGVNPELIAKLIADAVDRIDIKAVLTPAQES